MTEETQIIEYNDNKRPAKISPFDMALDFQIEFFSNVATKLRDIIEAQKLYSIINGKKYVKVDGWILMGTLLGLFAREVDVIEQPDGSFLAYIELVRIDNLNVMGKGSSLCGFDEARWGKADRYARRSMSITRAIGKTYRSNYSWIMALAGYEVTPAEEMPREERVETYSGSTEHQHRLEKILRKENVPEEQWPAVDEKMRRKEMTLAAIKTVLKEMQQ